MALTARAQGLVQPLADALGSLNGLLAQAEFDPAHARGRLRLALSDYASRIVLPPLMRHLRQHAPGLDLAISQSTREVMLAQLADGELDLALGPSPTHPTCPTASRCRICSGTVRERGRPGRAAGTRRAVTAGLAAAPHVMLAMRPDASEEIERALAAQGLSRRVVLALPHWSAALEVLAGTDLVLTVGSRAIGDLRRHKTLRRFAPPLELPRFAYQQAWHVRKQGMPCIGGCATRWRSAALRRGKHRSKRRPQPQAATTTLSNCFCIFPLAVLGRASRKW